MSMPVIAYGDGKRDQSVTDMIESVALEQTALSHIINAEGEKLQKAINSENVTIEEMMGINKSAQAMINAVARLEIVLQEKLELFSDCLCAP